MGTSGNVGIRGVLGLTIIGNYGQVNTRHDETMGKVQPHARTAWRRERSNQTVARHHTKSDRQRKLHTFTFSICLLYNYPKRYIAND